MTMETLTLNPSAINELFTNAIAIVRWQYPVLSDSTKKCLCNLEKVILRT